MYGNVRIVNTQKQFNEYRVEINAYWITIYKEGKIVFQRHADTGPWMDKQHIEITKHLGSLEDALLRAVNEIK